MKSVKSFIVKCILAAIPFITVVGFIWFFPFCYMDEEFPSWHYTKQVQDGRMTLPDKGNACLILGDSRAMADMVPVMMGDNYVNLGIGGATSVEMYYTLLHYIRNNGAPQRVFIMFAPFHYSYMDNYETRTLYFHHLSFLEAMEVYHRAVMFEQNAKGSYVSGIFPVSGDQDEDAVLSDTFKSIDRTDMLGIYLRSPSVYMPALINSRVFMRTGVNQGLYREQLETRGHALYGTADGCDDLNYEANYEHMKQDVDHRIITFYFEKLLKLCEDNGIDTCVLQAPMNEASYNSLKPGFMEEYASYVTAIARTHSRISFETEIPCYENRYFGDSSHLNEKGAKVYTEEVISRYIR